VIVTFVYWRNVPTTGTDAYCLHSSWIFFQLVWSYLLSCVCVPNVDWWPLSDLASHNLCSIGRNIKWNDVVSVEAQLVHTFCFFLSHRHLLATIEFLSVCLRIKDDSKGCWHVNWLALRIVSSEPKLMRRENLQILLTVTCSKAVNIFNLKLRNSSSRRFDHFYD